MISSQQNTDDQSTKEVIDKIVDTFAHAKKILPGKVAYYNEVSALEGTDKHTLTLDNISKKDIAIFDYTSKNNIFYLLITNQNFYKKFIEHKQQLAKLFEPIEPMAYDMEKKLKRMNFECNQNVDLREYSTALLKFHLLANNGCLYNRGDIYNINRFLGTDMAEFRRHADNNAVLEARHLAQQYENAQNAFALMLKEHINSLKPEEQNIVSEFAPLLQLLHKIYDCEGFSDKTTSKVKGFLYKGMTNPGGKKIDPLMAKAFSSISDHMNVIEDKKEKEVDQIHQNFQNFIIQDKPSSNQQQLQ